MRTKWMFWLLPSLGVVWVAKDRKRCCCCCCFFFLCVCFFFFFFSTEGEFSVYTVSQANLRIYISSFRLSPIPFEPAHEIMVFFVPRKFILQMRMRSHPMGLDVWFLVGSFFHFHTLCVQTVQALAGLRGCAGSPSPSLIAYVISTIISWAGSYYVAKWKHNEHQVYIWMHLYVLQIYDTHICTLKRN